MTLKTKMPYYGSFKTNFRPPQYSLTLTAVVGPADVVQCLLMLVPHDDRESISIVH
jgi:hypothetical protein